MAQGQIHDMNVVPQASAVAGVPIIAKHGEPIASTNGHLGNEGHQVVGQTTRILANLATWMGTDRVEVAQRSNGPGRVTGRQIRQDGFDAGLGPPVRVGRLDRGGLVDRDALRVTINRGRG